MVFARLALYRPSKQTEHLPERPINVVICARNEARNLERHLPRILRQKYRSLNVTVVNDESSDDSFYVLSKLQRIHPTLHTVDIQQKTTPGKKSALALGIRSATHDTLLLTDADCDPVSEEWVRRMSAPFADEQTEIVLGYGSYRRYDGWLNRCVRFETVWTAVQYLSFALIGLPYMGVGRNMAYRRSVFERVGGFSGHQDLPSGDDDLLVNAGATSRNVRIELSPESFMVSEPERSWADWIQQKQRHLTTGVRYRFVHQVLLGLYPTTHVLHLGMALWLGWNGMMEIALLGWTLRTASVWGIGGLICRKLNEKDLIGIFPILDLGLIGYYVFMGTVPFRKRKDW